MRYQAISFEKKISFSTEIAPICGIPDIYNKSGTLYEIKASKSALNKWKMQTFLYAAMLKYSRLHICKIVIVNLLEGIKYIFNINLIKPLSSLKLICDHYYDTEIYRKFIHKYVYNCRTCSKEDWERPGHFLDHPQFQDALFGGMMIEDIIPDVSEPIETIIKPLKPKPYT